MADDFKIGTNPPSADYLNWFLSQGDAISDKSPLHRSGTGPHDHPVGNHSHNGVNSAKLTLQVFTGDLSTTAGIRNALKQVMAVLVTLGATDSTTN